MDLFARELLLPRATAKALHIDTGMTSKDIAKMMGAPRPTIVQQLLDALLLPETDMDLIKVPVERPLNERQKAAAEHWGEPYLLQAGPGTGKTQTLVGRVAWLLAKNVDPRSILVLTFSNKAAGELFDRIAAMNPAAAAAMWIGTFHSFGRVLNALRTRLVNPGLFARFCNVFTQEMNRLRMEGRAEIAAAEAEIEKIDRELAKLLTAIKSGGPIEAIVDDMKRLEARKAELTAFLEAADEPPPLLHPSMAELYRSRVQQLYDALQDEDEEKRTEAADIIRTLVEDIVLTPVDGKVEIDVRGDLAGILTLSVQTKNPAGGRGGSQVKMVAGARNRRCQQGLFQAAA